MPENQNEAKTHRIQIRLSGDLTEGNCIEVDLDQLTEQDYTLGGMLVSVSVKNNLLKRNVVIASRVNFYNETDFPISLTIRDPNSDISDKVILKKSELVPISIYNLDAQIHLEYYDHTQTPEKHYKYPVKILRDFCGSSKQIFPQEPNAKRPKMKIFGQWVSTDSTQYLRVYESTIRDMSAMVIYPSITLMNLLPVDVEYKLKQ